MLGSKNSPDGSPSRSKPFKWLRRLFRRFKYRHAKFKDGKYMKGKKDVELWREETSLTHVDYPDYRWQALTAHGKTFRKPPPSSQTSDKRASKSSSNATTNAKNMAKANNRASHDYKSIPRTHTPKTRSSNGYKLTLSSSASFSKNSDRKSASKCKVPLTVDQSETIPKELLSIIDNDTHVPHQGNPGEPGVQLQLRPVYDIHQETTR